MVFEIDPRVDFAFKRLFGVESNKPLLIDLLNAVLGAGGSERIVDVTLLDPFNLKEFDDDKLSIVDVKARDQSGRQYTVEMQMIGYPEMPARFVYYLAESYRGQLSNAGDYADLRPSILIAFLCEPMFPQVDDYHLTFRLQESRHRIVFSEQLELHTIELSKYRASLDDLSPLDRWSHFLTFSQGHEMSQFPEVMLDDPVFQQAFDELEKMSHDPNQREAYNRRLRNLREERARLTSALRQGLAEGRAEGREEGRTVGREEGQAVELRRQIRLLQRILKLDVAAERELESLSLAELRQRAAELEQRCLEQAN